MDNAETVHQAILTLYGSDSSLSGRANVWLGEFQKSLHAWEICDKLLHDKKDEISCYFAAQTMRTKVQCAFQELPPTSYDSLRDSIIQHLNAFGAAASSPNQNVIVTQLSLALVDLYLQVPAWTGCVADVINRFGSDAKNSLTLLTLLKVFPEETESRHLKLGANRRKEVGQELAAQTNSVIQYLQTLAESQLNDKDGLVRVFSCLGAWLTNPCVPSNELAESHLLQLILQCLANLETPAKLHNSATDCIVQALYLIEDLRPHEKLAQILFTGLHQMVTAYHICVAQEDMDKLENLCRLFTELAESVLPMMVDTPGTGFGHLSTLDLILNVVGHHDYNLAEMTFSVWYRLSEFVYQRKNEQLIETFRPYVERFVLALYKHCRFESDFIGTPDETEDFSDFRSKTTEVIKDVVFIIGSTKCFRQMLEFLKQQCETSSWDETESALYIMTAVAKCVIPEEDEVVPVVVQAVLALSVDTHICIRYTAIRLLGQLYEWIQHNPQSADQIVAWLLNNFFDPKLSNVVAEALEEICSASKKNLVASFPGLHAAVAAVDNVQYNIPEAAVGGLLKGAAVVMSCLPPEEISSKLKELCSKQANGLAQVIEKKKNGASYGNSKKENSSERQSVDPVIWLDRLACIFKQLPPSSSDGPTNGKGKPWLPVVQELWPLLSETCDLYQNNSRVVEHWCRTIRYSIRSLGVESFPLIEPLVNKLVSIYQTYQHSSFLYLGSILVDEYGGFDEVGPGLLAMFQTFAIPTFTLLNQERGFTNHPDTVDDLFRLCIRFVQKAPFPFFQCDTAKPLFQCAVAALSLDHRDAHESVARFLVQTVEFLQCMQTRGVMNEGVAAAVKLYEEVGPELVKASIVGCLVLSSQVVRDFGEILQAFKSLNTQIFSDWLKQGLEHISVAEIRAGVTLAQLEEFHGNAMLAKDSKVLTHHLKDFIRLYR